MPTLPPTYSAPVLSLEKLAQQIEPPGPEQALAETHLIFNAMRARLIDMLRSGNLDGALAKELDASARAMATAYFKILELQDKTHETHTRFTGPSGADLTDIRENLARQLDRLAERQSEG